MNRVASTRMNRGASTSAGSIPISLRRSHFRVSTRHSLHHHSSCSKYLATLTPSHQKHGKQKRGKPNFTLPYGHSDRFPSCRAVLVLVLIPTPQTTLLPMLLHRCSAGVMACIRFHHIPNHIGIDLVSEKTIFPKLSSFPCTHMNLRYCLCSRSLSSIMSPTYRSLSTPANAAKLVS
jgi:hypothetical protein